MVSTEVWETVNSAIEKQLHDDLQCTAVIAVVMWMIMNYINDQLKTHQ